MKSPRVGLEMRFDGCWLRLRDPVVEDYPRTLSESERERLVERAGGLEERRKRKFGATPRFARERPQPAWQSWKHCLLS